MRIDHTRAHRYLKWVWLSLIPISYVWRESIFWVVFMSHYAIVASHWAAEEAADSEDEDEQGDAAQDA